ncbi:hypothetical protein Nmel_004611 [Mimus melanotis]
MLNKAEPPCSCCRGLVHVVVLAVHLLEGSAPNRHHGISPHQKTYKSTVKPI